MRVFLQIALQLVTAGALLPIFATSAVAEKNDRPGIVKRQYVHACPPGTEQIGDGPPKSSVVFCRQILNNGFKLEGDYTTFYQNGNKKSEGSYVNGRKNGTWKVYSKTGEVVDSKEFIQGNAKRKELTQFKREKAEQQQAQKPRLFYQDKEVLNQFRITNAKRIASQKPTKRYVYGISQ